jgi:hypothetical protein
MADKDDKKKKEGQSDELFTLRRAAVDWWRVVQKATSDHQERTAAALAEYHRTVGQIVEGMAKEQLAALESAAESQKPDTTPERRLTILREWNERVAEIRRTAFTRVGEAGTKLTEAQQQSWGDAAKKQNEAYIAYVSATADVNAAASPFPQGDEGRGAPPFGWNWMDPSMGQRYPGSGWNWMDPYMGQ